MAASHAEHRDSHTQTASWSRLWVDPPRRHDHCINHRTSLIITQMSLQYNDLHSLERQDTLNYYPHTTVHQNAAITELIQSFDENIP